MFAAVTILALLGAVQAPSPADDLAGLVRAYLGLHQPSDWAGIEGLPGTKWAPLPPTSLTNCLPNGDCFARQGTVALGGRGATIVATGARTMVVTILIRSPAAAGESALVGALTRAGLSATLARCPIRAGAGGTSWYRIGGAASPGFLSIQPAGAGRPTEGYILTSGDALPPLQPNQLALYTEQCAPGAERKPVSTSKPHEILARTMVALLAPAGTGLYDWKTLRSLPTEITWTGETPIAADLTSRGDSNPLMLSGSVAYAGRTFSVLASGTAKEVKLVAFEETGLHPRGEHLLGVVYEQGIAVRLVRCGPVYTESTNNWYDLSGPRTQGATVRQSIRYDGNQVQDSYELRLDGSLPNRDPRDRNPGVNGCR